MKKLIFLSCLLLLAVSTFSTKAQSLNQNAPNLTFTDLDGVTFLHTLPQPII